MTFKEDLVMATHHQKVVRYQNMISIRGQEFSIVVWKTITGEGDAIYGIKPQTCEFLRPQNRFQYIDLFRTAVWLSFHELNTLISNLIALASPSELKDIIARLEALAHDSQ